MRAVNLIGMLLFGISVLVIAPTITTGQPGGGSKKGGGFGGDPNTAFDYLANGRNFFTIAQARGSQSVQLAQFAQEKGISNGQITRQQYLEFYEWRAKQAAANGGNPFGKGGMTFGGKKGFGMDPSPQGGAQSAGPSPEELGKLAEAEFKSYDRNNDGKLNQEEVSGFLRKDFAKWDKNGDGLIDLNEYKEYFAAKMAARRQGDDSGRNGPAAIIIDDDELDRKAVVFRVGNMPAGLPAWFKELDTDNDGQVAVYEWRKAGKSMEEFANWDLNGDGFITPDEALKQQSALAKNDKRSPGTSLAAAGEGDATTGNGSKNNFAKPGSFQKGGKGGGYQYGPRPPMGDGGNPDSGSASDGGSGRGKSKKKGGGGN